MESPARGSEPGGCGVKRPKRAPILTLEGLERWFETATPEPPCEGVSMMNGFLTGLACGPIFLQPNDWMVEVIGEHEARAYMGNKVQGVIDTIVDHYNLIARQLANPGRYAPVLMRTDDEEVLPQQWADGFFGAVRLHLDAWRPLFTKEETAGPAMAILFHCSNPDMAADYSAVFGEPLTMDLTNSWRAIPDAVEAIYRQCAPMRAGPPTSANDA